MLNHLRKYCLRAGGSCFARVAGEIWFQRSWSIQLSPSFADASSQRALLPTLDLLFLTLAFAACSRSHCDIRHPVELSDCSSVLAPSFITIFTVISVTQLELADFCPPQVLRYFSLREFSDHHIALGSLLSRLCQIPISTKKLMARIKPQALLLQSKKKKGPSRVSLVTIITCNLLVILVVLSLYASYNHWYKRPSNQPYTEFKNSEHSKDIGEQKKFDLPGYAVMETSKGSITVELHKDSSPEVVDKFLDLCQKGYFKGMRFHRVIKHFVIQGGDPHNLGAAEEWTLHRKSNNQLETSPKHEAFMLGTSKAKANAKGFEIFITTAPISDLNDKVNVFGRVIKGEDVVQEIEEVDTDEQYQPKSLIEIINITLKQEP